MTFEERFSIIDDPQTLSAAMGIKNVAKYFRDEIKNNPDTADAETKMQAIESLWATIKADRDANEYKVKRQKEYADLDNLLLEAIAEKEMGDPRKMADYIILRQSIKSKYPKPE